MSADTTNPSPSDSDLESCKSFDSFGDILPFRKKTARNTTFETSSNEEEDIGGPGVRRPPNPYANASLLSKIFFIWPYSLLKTDARSHGEQDDHPTFEESNLPDVLDSDSSEVNLRKFHKLWEREKARAAKVMQQHRAKAEKSGTEVTMPKAASPSLARAIMNDFLSKLWFVQPMMFLYSAGKLVQALALGFLIQSFELEDGKGYIWAGLLVLGGFTVLISHHQIWFWTTQKGMQYRISTVAAIYDKSLRLKSASGDNSPSSGKAINLATNDVERFLVASMFGSYIIWAPALSIGILGLGWYIIGWPFAVGFFLLVFVVVPFQLYLSKKFAILRSEIASITDERVTLVSQAVGGARVMKMYNYEVNFEEKIASIRSREVASIQHVNRYRALNEALFYVANVFTALVIFFVKVASGGLLTPFSVFTSMVLLNVAQIEITKCLALAVMGVSEAKVSARRIQVFLEMPELSSTRAPLIDNDNGNNNEGAAIVVSQVTCNWNSNSANESLVSTEESLSANSLHNSSSSINEADSIALESTEGLVVALDNIDLDFRMGTLTCIIGSVGSGKSALVQMLAGELPLSSGVIRRVDGTVAYAPQDPFIMGGSVRDNILFGHAYDEMNYQTVVSACGLDIDFLQLREGENTMVGDRGVQLSGGQRARIALARAFYCNADIILLDDPLSAVDSKVGRQLYRAIQDLGVKAGKCVVLVTHQLQFCGDSKCIVMSGGRVECVGSYEKCAKASGLSLTFQNRDGCDDGEAKTELLREERIATDSENDTSQDQLSDTVRNENHDETSNVGVVKMETFISYCRAFPGGLLSGLALLLLFSMSQGAVVACVAVIGQWSVLSDQMSGNIIGSIVGLVLLVVILAVIRAFLYYFLVIEASKNLHDAMTRSVLRSKIDFFDTNPIGRILNRFSADVGSNDDLLPQTLFEFLTVLFMVLGAIIFACSVLPFTLIIIPPIFVSLLRVRKLFMTTSRELKRVEGLARSPIFALLGEALDGIVTIRSNGTQEYFKQKFREAHDAHGRAFFAFIAITRWFGFRCDALMFMFISIASFAAVIVNDQAWLDIEPSILGLALTMLIQLSGLFQYGIRQSAEVVNQMVAVERINGFRDLPSEAALTTQYDDEVAKEYPHTGWPINGTIDVKGLNVRYRPGLPLSLSGLTFKIDGGSRVGVVGRTGCGKSTLVQSLLRLLEAEDGQIKIDSADISRLGLSRLRKSISVIPQIPVLYGGVSLRNNLDMFEDRTDEEIREALSHASMLDAVRSLPRGLDTTVAEGGSNFSIGQRQLLCLARAMLRKNKILVLDEPTANVDGRTDKLLQRAVAANFRGSTILAVAHRLDTVIDYDKILVLGSGRVLEYGSPHELIAKGGAFCSMVDETGDMADTLKARAKKSEV